MVQLYNTPRVLMMLTRALTQVIKANDFLRRSRRLSQTADYYTAQDCLADCLADCLNHEYIEPRLVTPHVPSRDQARALPLLTDKLLLSYLHSICIHLHREPSFHVQELHL
jgi:hypothetical protein